MNPIRQSTIFNPKDASEMRDIQETLSMVGIQYFSSTDCYSAAGLEE